MINTHSLRVGVDLDNHFRHLSTSIVLRDFLRALADVHELTVLVRDGRVLVRTLVNHILHVVNVTIGVHHSLVVNFLVAILA